MLRELVIKNFAIVDTLEVSLGGGLTCLTGETGAGKSIMVDAISFLLGARPGPGVGREGVQTEVSAQFDITGAPGVRALLDEQGFDTDTELVMRRVITASGRGKAFINGSLANISTLQEAGDLLVDLHGQHEHQSLLKVDSHVELLDEYCGLDKERRRCRDAYDALSGINARLAELTGREREAAQREDLLRFQVSEIDAAALTSGEDDVLVEERARLAHVDRLRALANEATEALRDSEASALSLIDAAKSAADGIAELSPGQAEPARLIDSASISLAEACSLIRDFTSTLEADPERLAVVEDRLELIKALKKKYGDSIDDILAFRDDAGAELTGIASSADEIARLRSEADAAGKELTDAAADLSKKRAHEARGFEKKVASELSELGMPKAVFKAGMTPLGGPGPRGADRVEFLFSANPGKEPLPLAKIASGGELSRVMLALKVILTGTGGVPTLVFDEVDSGVGGVTAGAVGRKLKAAAAGRQVLCITHLPQIASMAAEHLSVEKDLDGTTAKVRVRRLGKQERVDELARMLGGDEGSATASAHAEELVRQGEA